MSEDDPTHVSTGPREVGRNVAHFAASAALLFFPPVAAGVMLLLSLVRKRRFGSWWPDLVLAGSTSQAFLDVTFTLALSASLALGALSHSMSAPAPELVLWLPPLMGALSLASARAHAWSGRTNTTGGVARLLLALGLVLTPFATALSHMTSAYWAVTVLAAWGAIHALQLARAVLMRLDPQGVARQNRIKLLGKGSALRNAAAAFSATAIDFAVFSGLVQANLCSPPIATFVGAALGGLFNFTINRKWTFRASGSGKTMARRYVTVSATSAALNASMVAVLMWLPNQHVAVVWVVARGLVFLGWNYPLHRDYVFGHSEASSSP